MRHRSSYCCRRDGCRVRLDSLLPSVCAIGRRVVMLFTKRVAVINSPEVVAFVRTYCVRNSVKANERIERDAMVHFKILGRAAYGASSAEPLEDIVAPHLIARHGAYLFAQLLVFSPRLFL